jgi:hypothetical protein
MSIITEDINEFNEMNLSYDYDNKMNVSSNETSLSESLSDSDSSLDYLDYFNS